MMFAKNKYSNIFTIFNATPIAKGVIWKGKNRFKNSFDRFVFFIAVDKNIPKKLTKKLNKTRKYKFLES